MENNQEKQIQANLWHTMNSTELNEQLSLLYDKRGLLVKMPPSDVVVQMRFAIESAIDQLTKLIDTK